GLQHLHPWRVTAPVTSLWLLIGESGQAAQMTPIGAGQVAAVEAGQLFADPAGHGSFDRCGTDLHPNLEIAGAGLEYHSGSVSIAAHGFDDDEAGLIQIDEDVARMAFLGIELEVYVAAFPIARAQKSYSGRMRELSRGPQPLSGESPLGRMVNQADQVKVVRHRRELAAYRLHGEIESTVEHGHNFEIAGNRRTMNSQRTANSGLTGCLNPWVHLTMTDALCRPDHLKRASWDLNSVEIANDEGYSVGYSEG